MGRCYLHHTKYHFTHSLMLLLYTLMLLLLHLLLLLTKWKIYETWVWHSVHNSNINYIHTEILKWKITMTSNNLNHKKLNRLHLRSHIYTHACVHTQTHPHIKYMRRNTCTLPWLLLPLLFKEKCLTKITKLQNAIFADQEVFRFDICKRKQGKKCNALDCTIIGTKSKCWRTSWHSKQTNPRYIINKAHIQTNHRPMITKVCHLA